MHTLRGSISLSSVILGFCFVCICLRGCFHGFSLVTLNGGVLSRLRASSLHAWSCIFFFLILSHVEQLGLVGFTVFKTLRSCPTLPLSLSLFLLTLFSSLLLYLLETHSFSSHLLLCSAFSLSKDLSAKNVEQACWAKFCQSWGGTHHAGTPKPASHPG